MRARVLSLMALGLTGLPAFASEPALPVVTEPLADQRQAVYGLLRAPTSFDVDAGPTLSLVLPAGGRLIRI